MAQKIILLIYTHNKTLFLMQSCNFDCSLFSFPKHFLNRQLLQKHTRVFIQELLSWAVCVYEWKAGALLFAHHHLDCFQLIISLKNVKNTCHLYIRTGITNHIFSFIAKNILFLESFCWTPLPLMSIWISPAVQSAFLGNRLWEAGYKCSLSLKYLNYNLGKNSFFFSSLYQSFSMFYCNSYQLGLMWFLHIINNGKNSSRNKS